MNNFPVYFHQEIKNYEEKNLECQHPGCGKVFNSCWSLTRHSRTHTGRKPFKCESDGCNKEFVEKCALRRHEQTHNEDKRWECNYPKCGKKFKLKEYLDVHKKTHAKGKHNYLELGGFSSSPNEGSGSLEEVSLSRERLVIQHLSNCLASNNDQYIRDISNLQKDNQRLHDCIRECSFALEMAINLAQAHRPENPIPVALTNILMKVRNVEENWGKETQQRNIGPYSIDYIYDGSIEMRSRHLEEGQIDDENYHDSSEAPHVSSSSSSEDEGSSSATEYNNNPNKKQRTSSHDYNSDGSAHYPGKVHIQSLSPSSVTYREQDRWHNKPEPYQRKEPMRVGDKVPANPPSVQEDKKDISPMETLAIAASLLSSVFRQSEDVPLRT